MISRICLHFGTQGFGAPVDKHIAAFSDLDCHSPMHVSMTTCCAGSYTCNAFMCMHLGNHSASSEVHNPHLETSCAPFGSCRALFKGPRAFRRIPVPAGPRDGRFGGWAGQLNDFSAGHLKSDKLDSNQVQLS